LYLDILVISNNRFQPFFVSGYSGDFQQPPIFPTRKRFGENHHPFDRADAKHLFDRENEWAQNRCFPKWAGVMIWHPVWQGIQLDDSMYGNFEGFPENNGA